MVTQVDLVNAFQIKIQSIINIIISSTQIIDTQLCILFKNYKLYFKNLIMKFPLSGYIPIRIQCSA